MLRLEVQKMKFNQFISALVCTLLLALLLAIVYARASIAEPTPEPLIAAAAAEAQQNEQTAEPEQTTDAACRYELYFAPEDAEMIAKTVYGEARGCDVDGQAKVVWCILNRVDDARFPDTIQGVITQPHQFHGYCASFPVTEDIYAVVYDVLTRWSLEKQGIAVYRELPQSFVFFTGNGTENIFREVY